MTFKPSSILDSERAAEEAGDFSHRWAALPSFPANKRGRLYKWVFPTSGAKIQIKFTPRRPVREGGHRGGNSCACEPVIYEGKLDPSERLLYLRFVKFMKKRDQLDHLAAQGIARNAPRCALEGRMDVLMGGEGGDSGSGGLMPYRAFVKAAGRPFGAVAGWVRTGKIQVVTGPDGQKCVAAGSAMEFLRQLNQTDAMSRKDGDNECKQ